MDNYSDREFVLYSPYIRDPSFLNAFSVFGRMDLSAGQNEGDLKKYSNNLRYALGMEELARYIFFREKVAEMKDAAGWCLYSG